MSYNLQQGDIVKLQGNSTKLRVLSAPLMVKHFADRGEEFGWVKCEVISDPSGIYEVGFIDEFNGDFLRKD